MHKKLYRHTLGSFYKTSSNLLHHTGRFKVKRMVQTRILRKQNPASHYANAEYFFYAKGQHNFGTLQLLQV